MLVAVRHDALAGLQHVVHRILSYDPLFTGVLLEKGLDAKF